MTRFGTSIDKDTYFWLIDGIRIRIVFRSQTGATHLKLSTNSIEKPSMRVDFLLVFGFENKNDLHRDKIVLIVRLREYELRCCVH